MVNDILFLFVALAIELPAPPKKNYRDAFMNMHQEEEEMHGTRKMQ